MKSISKAELAKYIDHTILKPDATTEDILNLCSEAIKYGFASVCVNPCHIERCVPLLRPSGIKTATVIGFPLGATKSEVKFYEAGLALLAGADELDMVINIGWLKSGRYDELKKEVSDIALLCKDAEKTLKVIIETSLLTEQEKITACKIVSEADAGFIKTSTGFSGGGATLEDIKLMRKHCSSNVKIKASGGIKTLEFALELIEAGADRIGTSSGVSIINEAK